MTLENLADLKVVDLKSELDKREIKYKPNAKKAELVALLRENLTGSLVAETEATIEKAEVAPTEDNQQDQQMAPPAEASETAGEATQTDNSQTLDGNQLEEGEVVNDDSNDSVEHEEATKKTSKRKNLDGQEDGRQDVSATESACNKKVCRVEETSKDQQQQKVKLIREPFVVKAKVGQQQLSLVSLNEAIQISRHDQFELSVSSNILRESLVQHLCEYILTTLVEENRLRQSNAQATSATTSASQSSDTHSTSSSVSNTQELQCDTNNNSNNNKQQAFKTNNNSSDKINNPKEFPVDRYINLAFTYFDSNQMGYMFADDLNKLFSNCGLSLSKRALTSLIGDSDKFHYRCLPDLLPKLSPSYVYQFPGQFLRLPGSGGSEAGSTLVDSKMVELQGVQYNIESLVKQTKEAETLRVNLLDRFNYAIENSDKQAEEIHVLEVSRKSLSKAIKAQNDEICELKRERDSLKKKFDSLRKGIKSTISSLSEQINENE